MKCETTTFRGFIICKHSEHKHVKLASLVGDDMYFKLVQGSYNTSIKESANTHSLGGATDQELDGYTFAKGRFCETIARNQCDLLYYLRWWAGNHHGHIADPECPNMANELAAQFVLFGRGTDALIGGNDDTGDRSNVNRLMNLFSTRRATVNRIKLMQRAVGVTIDGVWGPVSDAAFTKVRNTKTGAIRGIQTGLFVTPDGVWGEVTDAAFVQLRILAYKAGPTAPPVPPQPTPKPSPPKPATPTPVPGSTYTGSKVIDVSKVRPKLSNEAVRRFNGLMWSWLCKNSPNYARANSSLWMKEAGDYYGPQAQRATQEMYRVLADRYPAKFKRVSLPTWPGDSGVRAIGGTPI